MSTQIGIWRIENNQPVRLQRSQVKLEKYLEEWIEKNPAMVGHGISIVGRQVHCDGGFIDLLAIDRYTNSWVVIEIKRGNVRRETVSQAIDYIASIDMMPADELRDKVNSYLQQHGTSVQEYLDNNLMSPDMFENDRDIKIIVVGTGRDTNLSRTIDYLVDKNGMQISVVEFDIFEGNSGELSLVRQLTEQDEPQTKQQSTSNMEAEYERLFTLADANGIGKQFRLIYDTCVENGLYPRTYKWSIMYTPPEHKGRCLVVAWVKPVQGKLQAFAIPETFAEYFPIDEAQVRDIIGASERRLLNLEHTNEFVARLKDLFSKIEK